MNLKQALITYSSLVTMELDGFYVNWVSYWHFTEERYTINWRNLGKFRRVR